MEIQAAGKIENGVLRDWAWIGGENKPADWVTSPRPVGEQAVDGLAPTWQSCTCSQEPDISIQPKQRGPKFLRSPFEDWPIRTTFKEEQLEGDLLPK